MQCSLLWIAHQGRATVTRFGIARVGLAYTRSKRASFPSFSFSSQVHTKGLIISTSTPSKLQRSKLARRLRGSFSSSTGNPSATLIHQRQDTALRDSAEDFHIVTHDDLPIQLDQPPTPDRFHFSDSLSARSSQDTRLARITVPTPSSLQKTVSSGSNVDFADLTLSFPQPPQHIPNPFACPITDGTYTCSERFTMIYLI
jgi:hypothetical protein